MIPSLVTLAVGLLFIALYILTLRHRFGVRVDVVQALLYRVDPEQLAPADRLLEFSVRMLRNIGVFIAVLAVVGMFAE